MNSEKVTVQPWYTVTDEELMLMSSQNPELRFERNADGTIETMPPTGGISGNREAKAVAYLLAWVESQDLGEVFGPSTGFKLANTAVKSPDAAFVAKGRLPENWDQQEDAFINLAPDFVIEIRSKNDSLPKLKAKMAEYIANGVQLGWLIDRQNQQAFVYRRDGSITQYPETAILNGEDVVPGFTLALAKLL
ncbi:Uma2 family endonuclease [Nostoc sp. FACHB-87]|uniref:Uma2 family endonuclease n=1 Tax=Nostocaceae TaxID=1162 RepID=UPI0016895C0A|nr:MULTISPECIES: Uma2 family endonuclease [Nostocaceae]MBD2453320.1 Uma2 family endonuclease [Nostoc sp. FACHB-87]MBD2475444.1 Uma2 family endonuclease [Anabaena sp. FACHB-83]